MTSNVIDDSDEDDDLYSSINIARKTILSKRKEVTMMKPEDYVTKAIQESEKEKEKNNNNIIENGQVYSSTLEFSRRLDETLKQRKLDQERKVTDNKTDIKTDINMEIEENTENDNENEENENENQNEGFGRDVPSYNGGLASVLKLCAQQGYIEEKEEMIGRNKDARIAYEPGSNFVIEHRDEYGNLLSTKEAFRQLSYTFHGYAPKKNHLGKNKMRFKESIAKKGGKVV